jgi:hypothetical protein
MTSLTRRSLLKSALALPVAMAMPRDAFANPGLVRYDLSTPEGLDMLATFAQGVRLMQAMGPDNQMSWMWQWYTHFVDPRTTKELEMSRMFGDTASPIRTRAEEMWNTCQSHAGQNPNHFLPWHRMFVYFFERIVRQVTGRADFALPYWDYTSTDPTKRGVVPLQFRLPEDPVFDCLYRPERTALANGGEPIHKNQPVDSMDIDALMRKEAYSSAGSVMGFCRTMDSGIHGRMHVLIGNASGMGSVPYAGRDPLFWVHHSNIDRMWASWNRNGGRNPSGTDWGQTHFVFVDGNGQRVRRKLSDFFSVLALGYDYDRLIPRPMPEETPASASTLLAAAATGASSGARVAPEEVVARAPSAKLRGQPVSVTLSPLPGARRGPVLGLDPARPHLRTYLILKDLHTWSQPEVLFHVYLRPGNGAGKLDKASYVGDINFFDAEFHDHGTSAAGASASEALGDNAYSFDVTRLLQSMLGKSGTAASNALRVTIVPAGAPTASAEPLVSTIELVQQ